LFRKSTNCKVLFPITHQLQNAFSNKNPTAAIHGKDDFVTATKVGTTDKFFVAATKNFAAATKRFVDRTKYFVVVTKYFCYPYFKK